MTDVWIGDPKRHILIALDEGFTKFTWHLGALSVDGSEALSWFRTSTMGYSQDCRLMLIDHYGAPEYSQFCRYGIPIAVYPTWTPEESLDNLIWLMENPVGDDENYYNDMSVPREMRVVKGQKHRVVIHRVPSKIKDAQPLLLMLREIQLKYPHVDMFISGQTNFTYVLGYNFSSADWIPVNRGPGGYFTKQIMLPSGKVISAECVYSVRYLDWFDLVGMNQNELKDANDFTRYNFKAFAWASRNWNRIVPFAGTYRGKKNFVPADFKQVPDTEFKITAMRRRAMRNLGRFAGELDQFACDTCILQNACIKYQEGSVCVVEGSETVSLAKSFGTRSSSAIISALGALLEKQVERLEQAQDEEDIAGELNPEVTKMYKGVFEQGVKLAKLIDPTLSGPQVSVNVGIGAPNTQTALAQADPRQVIAGIVAELEANGVRREDITSEMIKGVLQSAAKNAGAEQAIQAIAAKQAVPVQRKATRVAEPKVIAGEIK